MGATAFHSGAANLLRKYIVPIVLGAAMLAVVVAAVLTSNANGGQAQTSSQPSSSISFSWTNAGIAALVVVPSGLLVLFLLGHRRSPATSAPTVQPSKVGSTPPYSPPAGAAPLTPVQAAASGHPETAQGVRRAPSAVPVGAARAPRSVAIGGETAAGGKPGSHVAWLVAEIDEIYRENEKRDPRMQLWERAPELPPSRGQSVEPGAPQTTLRGLPGDERPDGSARTPDSSHLEAMWIAHATATFHIGSRSRTVVDGRQVGPNTFRPWRKPPSI
jgi:hypothetical protein